MLSVLDFTDSNFDALLDALLDRGGERDESVEKAVAEIVSAVRLRGDEALVEYTARLDRRPGVTVADLELPRAHLDEVLRSLAPNLRDALTDAAERIRNYHEQEVQRSWEFEEPDGTRLGQLVIPMDSVGIYVPGGKASYPSSVLMTAIPARVAGVENIVMVVPSPDGELDPGVLAAASLAGVDRVFTVGGAQAVAALAYGTNTVPAVDKIVGPGNIWVATAKKQVFGQVGIDMIAGPSEVVVICDDSVDPDWVAMDLFAQAEHDEMAQSIAITWLPAMAEAVCASVDRLLPTMERRDIIGNALTAQGAVVTVPGPDEAVAVANRIAPEHLELMVGDPDALIPGIRHAGAIFAGAYSAESLGDYCAGPNHVLPTAGTARFSSPLGVYDYQKRSSLIRASRTGANTMAGIASVLARCEGLTAHARSAEYRLIARHED